MKIGQIYYNESTAEIHFSEDFFTFGNVIQLDLLQDMFHDLQEAYNWLVDNPEFTIRDYFKTLDAGSPHFKLHQGE